MCAQPFRYIKHFFLLRLFLLRRRLRPIVVVVVRVGVVYNALGWSFRTKRGPCHHWAHTPVPVKTQKKKKKNEITLIYKDSLSLSTSPKANLIWCGKKEEEPTAPPPLPPPPPPSSLSTLLTVGLFEIIKQWCVISPAAASKESKRERREGRRRRRKKKRWLLL